MNELQDIDLRALIEKETSSRFDKQGYICCPFHNEKTPSLSIKFNSNNNKYRFRCWGCDASGDSIDFIMQLKGFNYIKAREYLGMENKKSIKEEQLDKVKGYIQWQIEKTDFKNGYKLLGLFQFVDSNNKAIYYKAKLLKPDGKKETPYYSIGENDRVISKRGTDEVPYNYYKSIKAINDEKVLIFVEGEKDVNTLNSLLKGLPYEATSIKGCKDIGKLRSNNTRVYVIGDTGEAGDKYKWNIYHLLNPTAKEFRFINLPGLKSLGDNKDVTDWIESGHTKDELINAFNRSLDLRNKFELQQDSMGIYWEKISKAGELYKQYLTNFRLIEATRIKFIDEEQEGVRLTLKSSTGATVDRMGPSTVFDDLKSFKNFLGSIDLGIKGKNDDLTDLKQWVNKYFALEVEEVYQGSKFISKNGQVLFVTETGALSKDGNINKAIKSIDNCINIEEKEDITKEELLEVKSNIFKFSGPEKSISVIGTIINNMMIGQSEEIKNKLHHLLIVGEAGAGKSTILENVIAPILNYPLREKKSIGLASSFTLTQDFSNGNYTTLYEEFKPSNIGLYKMSVLSEFLRNLYDRTTIIKGKKDLTVKKYTLSRPIIIVGEESYPNAEKALMERSCIVYFSKSDQNAKSGAAIKWIRNNEELLNKLGKSLIKTALSITSEEYQKIRDIEEEKLKGLKNRPLSTAINVCCGIQILNKLLTKHKIKNIKKYEEHVIANIKNEVLDGGEEAYSTVEQMLLLYNSMIEDGRALDPKEVIVIRGDGLFIRTTEMINQIHMFVNQVGAAEVIPLKARDFKKQSAKAGYLLKPSSKVIKIGNKSVRFDEYSKDLMRDLKVDSIIEPEFMKVSDEEQKVIEGVFPGA